LSAKTRDKNVCVSYQRQLRAGFIGGGGGYHLEQQVHDGRRAQMLQELGDEVFLCFDVVNNLEQVRDRQI